MLEGGLRKLINLILDQSSHNKIQTEELENITSAIIADDGFDSLPGQIQDAVYFIDMHEIENPSTKQLIESAEKVRNFLKE